MTTSPPAGRQAWTKQQRLAIETRDVSVALSAGAGCGKTFVLTERFLDYFRPGPDSLRANDLGRLIAITFTDRAAREMRERIRHKCFDELLRSPDAEAEHWSSLVRQLDRARISTIHAFCSTLVRAHAVEAGIDPAFEVLEQSQADTLLSEAIDDEIRLRVAERDAAAIELAVAYDLKPLNEMLRTLVLTGTPAQFAEWLRRSPSEIVELWRAFHQRTVVPAICENLHGSSEVRTILEVLREHVPHSPVMRARRESLLDCLPNLATLHLDSLPPALQVIYENARIKPGGEARQWDDPEAYARFRDAAKSLRDEVDGLRAVASFDPGQARQAASVGLQLLGLADGVRRRYDERKSELAALDFNDLLEHAQQLLTDPANRGLRERLAGQIRLLLVDEFQDTDPLQVELVKALCGANWNDGKLFFVGDYKQSIYRFRGANPKVFAELRDQTPVAGQQSLTLNFRSQPAILYFVNALFWHELEHYEPLVPHRPQVSRTPAIEFLWAAPQHPATESKKESREEQRAREARWIAARLREMLDSGEPVVWDAEAAKAGTPAARAAQPGDIAILFRALSDVDLYEKALRDQGIDYYLVGGHAFYAQQEIFDLLNLLRAVNSTADVVSLVGALRCGMFSLTDESVYWLSQHPDGLWAGLVASRLPTQLPPEQKAQVRFAAQTLTELRSMKDRLRVSELIELALERTGYDAVLVDDFLGARKLANLRKIIEEARSFQRGDFLSLADYITQLSQFVARQPDEPLAATHSEDTNVVRLMTIHQSKGLEFPIVVVPDLNRPTRAANQRAYFNSQLGPLVKMPDAGGERVSSGGFDLWRYLESREESAESTRLLYVAATRAADYLLLSSGVDGPGSGSGPWMQVLSRQFDLLSGQFHGKLPTDEPRPAVKVTVNEPAAGATTRGTRRADLAKTLAAQEDSVGESTVAIARLGPDLRAARQYSFSRLTAALHPQAGPQAAFEAAPSPDPRGLGTLMHTVLATVDFRRNVDCRSIIERHADQHLGDRSGDIEVAVEMLERFMNSPRRRELAAAKVDHAETEFLLAWPPGGKHGAGTSLSGYIDRLYQDAGGGWHVLDFKTNRVPEGQLARTASQYEMQMLVYGLATEQILGQAPSSLRLHFLRSDEEVEFAWDAEARKRVVREVDAAIAALAKTLAAS